MKQVVIDGLSIGGPMLLYDSSVTPPDPPITAGNLFGASIAAISATKAGIGFNGNNGSIPAFFSLDRRSGNRSTASGRWWIIALRSIVSPFAAAAEYSKPNIFTHCLCQKHSDWNCIRWNEMACATPPDYITFGFGDELDDEEFDGVAPFKKASR